MRILGKKIRVRLAFTLLIGCVFSNVAIRAANTNLSTDLGQFPPVQATSLEKTKLRLPQELSAPMNLVIISFAREQQQQVDTWAAAARQVQPAHVHFNYYELMTMSSENLLYRWWFDAALRSNTANKDMRNRILTAYVSKHKFRMSLRIQDEKQVVAMLVDRSGKVYWRTDGPCTGENKSALLSALAGNGL